MQTIVQGPSAVAAQDPDVSTTGKGREADRSSTIYTTVNSDLYTKRFARSHRLNRVKVVAVSRAYRGPCHACPCCVSSASEQVNKPRIVIFSDCGSPASQWPCDSQKADMILSQLRTSSRQAQRRGWYLKVLTDRLSTITVSVDLTIRHDIRETRNRKARLGPEAS